jgi:hypothetical protein
MTYRDYQRREQLATQRRAQDRRDAAQAAIFDLAAQDLHHKHDRPHFAVVGEGTRTAQDAYRAGWDRIFGRAE